MYHRDYGYSNINVLVCRNVVNVTQIPTFSASYLYMKTKVKILFVCNEAIMSHDVHCSKLVSSVAGMKF
jgi:hypothetical protein